MRGAMGAAGWPPLFSSGARRPSAIAASSARAIAPDSDGTSLTAPNRSLPRCRSPTFTTGTPKAGASMIPLEELPRTAPAARSIPQYR